MATWQDLSQSIRATCRIDAAMVADIATKTAEREVAEMAKLGIPWSFEAEFSYRLALTQSMAKTTLDIELGRREIAALSPAARAAAMFEARARLAETSIPPNPAKAADLREMAQVCRDASWQANVVDLRALVAAE